MLPDSVEGDGFWSNLYNRTLGSRVYREDVKPIVDKALGGTLRLFAEKVYEGSYWGNEESEPVLSISATLPNGSTVEQMNALVQRMESYLSEFTEIRQFQTNVHSAYRASIQVYFRAEHQHSAYSEDQQCAAKHREKQYQVTFLHSAPSFQFICLS